MKPYWEQHLPATYQPDALIQQDLLRIDSSALELCFCICCWFVASARVVVGFGLKCSPCSQCSPWVH